MADSQTTRPHPRTREGVVLKDRMAKSRIVGTTRLYRHPRFHKVVKERVKYAAHDEKNESRVGDRVRMVETRPLSRTKRWRIIEVIERAKH